MTHDADPSLLRELTKRLARWRGFTVGYDLRARFDPDGDPDYQGVIVVGRMNFGDGGRL